ncbi:DUF1015 domain-containing protein [Treponema sp.]
MIDQLKALGIQVPDILIPKPGTDLEAWAVVACDQFTQDQVFWANVEKRVGSLPSTLRLILPEIFLERNDRAEQVQKIQKTMTRYRDNGYFAPALHSILYIERSTPHQPCRRGLMLCIDLERYEWQRESRPLIRASEGTVQERIPPRMEIRRGAALEVPHILLLIDDDERSLIEVLGQLCSSRKSLYSTSLGDGAGSVQGWALNEMQDMALLTSGFKRLADKAATRYGLDESQKQTDPFLFAVGDGNHSLATAKAVWDEYKAAHKDDKGLMDHPARWALVEVENLYDPAIEFEPIHRVLFNSSLDEVQAALQSLPGFKARSVSSPSELEKLVQENPVQGTRYGLVSGSKAVLIETNAQGVSTEAIQPLLDSFVQSKPTRNIDYLHGAEESIRVASTPNTVGILLPPIGKSDLFSTVARFGPLPRKSFSMGEAIEKRFYLECRSLFR